MTLGAEAEALAEALEHDVDADYAHLPTPVVAEWLALADGDGLLPVVHAYGRRVPARMFARKTAESCVWFRWVVCAGESNIYKITRAGRAALVRYHTVAETPERRAATAAHYLARRGL